MIAGQKVQKVLSPCLIHRQYPREFRVSDAHVGHKQKAWGRCRRAAMHFTKSYASDSDSGDEDAAVDIDALARKLSQEAERLRRTESNKEASTSEPTGSQYAADDPIFGQQVRRSDGCFNHQRLTPSAKPAAGSDMFPCRHKTGSLHS